MENGLSFTEIAQRLTELGVDFFDGTRFLPLSQVMRDLQRTYTRSTYAVSTVELYEQIAEIANAYGRRAGASEHPRFDEIFPYAEVRAYMRYVENAILDAITNHTGIETTINTTGWWRGQSFATTQAYPTYLPSAYETGWCTATPSPGINLATATGTRVRNASGDLLPYISEAIKSAQRDIQHSKQKEEAPDFTELDKFLAEFDRPAQKGVRAT